MGTPDVLVQDLGKTWLTTPLTRQARAWVKDNVLVDYSLDRHWDGGGFAVLTDEGPDLVAKFIMTSDLTIGGRPD